ncbi:unnamed protein product [Effrenium voratum]|uniref:Uncharacterized protein n=1 Tax=Effrenium voratum TaxID=2562239 RepID=A0AA36MUD6_9DINO|nr:unnamed protein product [Effrenium voratum]
MAEKPHLSVVIAGHADSGKSTAVGRLIYDLGGLPEREMDKLRRDAENLGKSGSALAFYMDKMEERAKGMTIASKNKEFFTEKWHYTIVDVPGHREFIKNMVTGSSMADVAVVLVAADSDLGLINDQTREYTRVMNLLGVQQLCICVNKMDCAGYSQSRYQEVANETKAMLTRSGWRRVFVETAVPVLPISGICGDNLQRKSDRMGWWNGQSVVTKDKQEIHVETLLDVLDRAFLPPQRKDDTPLRMPLCNVFNVKGVGCVVSGRVEQGIVKPGEEVVFLPSMAEGKVFSIEMHHKRKEQGIPGDVLGLNIKGVDKARLPRIGDVMIYKTDTSLSVIKEFDAQVQVLEVPKAILPKFSPMAIVRTGHAPCTLTAIKWKVGRETKGKKVENPSDLKASQMAQCTFVPHRPLVVDTFRGTPGLARLSFFHQKGLVMTGKVVSFTKAEGSVQEVIAAFKRFDKDGNGRISRSELATVFKSLNPNMTDRDLDDLMNSADKNNDGSLEIAEFVNSLFQSKP